MHNGYYFRVYRNEVEGIVCPFKDCRKPMNDDDISHIIGTKKEEIES